VEWWNPFRKPSPSASTGPTRPASIFVARPAASNTATLYMLYAAGRRTLRPERNRLNRDGDARTTAPYGVVRLRPAVPRPHLQLYFPPGSTFVTVQHHTEDTEHRKSWQLFGTERSGCPSALACFPCGSVVLGRE